MDIEEVMKIVRIIVGQHIGGRVPCPGFFVGMGLEEEALEKLFVIIYKNSKLNKVKDGEFLEVDYDGVRVDLGGVL